MEVLVGQGITVVALFLTLLAFFLLPYCLVRRSPRALESAKHQLGLSLANCFSGGVFLATFFVGLLPEVRELFLDVLKDVNTDFPVTETVVFAGFFLALLAEQSALAYRDCRKHAVGASDDHLDEDDTGSHGHSHAAAFLSGDRGVRICMLLLSLGVHSLFEGLALGLQSELPALFRLLLGVAMHEWLVAFALGVSVARFNLPATTNVWIACLFSASIPVGQVLGIVIQSHQHRGTKITSAVLQGLAAGTFVHVTFLEAIPSELQHGGNRMLKVACLLGGFLLLLGCSVIMHAIH